MGDDWIMGETATLALGDARLVKRARGVFGRLWGHLGQGVAGACQGWAEVMGAYRFFAHPRVTVAALLAPHQQATRARVAAEPVVLVPQDTTELCYSRHNLAGAGPLNYAHRTGLFLHLGLATTPAGVALGVVQFRLWARQRLGKRQLSSRPREALAAKESLRWAAGWEVAQTLAEAAPQTQVVSLADREGDLYDIFAAAAQAAKQGPHAWWIIRARHNRRVGAPGQPPRPLQLVLALAPIRAWATVPVPAHRGQPARSARCQVRVAALPLRPPPRSDGALPAVTVTGVWVREVDPPAEGEAVDWMLLTDLPTATLHQLRLIVSWYARRWDIEVFFRTLKSGCRVERLQFEDVTRLAPCLALCTVLTWRVRYLAGAAQACPGAPAALAAAPEEWQLAWRLTHPRGAPPATATVGEVVRWIAQLGGFLGRTRDGTPGAETLWRGVCRLYEGLAALHRMRDEVATCV